MKDTIYNILLILGTLGLPMATSTLLDIQWINQHWTRVLLVLIFMLLQLLIGGYMFFLKNRNGGG